MNGARSARAGRYYNVLYGIDSDSCADEMDRLWMSGNLGAIAGSAIAPLVETWVHLRREFQILGDHFRFVKFPGDTRGCTCRCRRHWQAPRPA